VEAFAEILLAIDHAGAEATEGECVRAGEAGEAGAHHDHVITLVLHRWARAPSKMECSVQA